MNRSHKPRRPLNISVALTIIDTKVAQWKVVCPPALRSRRDNRSSGLRFYLAVLRYEFLLCRDGARLVGARLVVRRLQ